MKLMATVTTLAAAAIVATVGMGSQVTHADGINDLKQTLTTKKAATSGLQSQLQASQADIAKLDAKMTAKAVAVKDTTARIDALSTKVAGYDAKIAQAKAEVANRTEVLKQQLVALQKQAGNSVTGNVYVDFVLNADGIDDVISRSATVGKLSAANTEALNDVKDAQQTLKQLKQDAVSDQAALEADKAALLKTQDQMKTAYIKMQTKQSDLQKKITANQDAVDALQGDITKANDKAKQDAAKAATATPKAADVKATTTAQPTATAAPAQQAAAQPAKAQPAPQATGSMGGIVGIAQRYIGVPYVWGGSTPSGFDCSGLVAYAAAQAGISLPRTSGAQSTLGTSVSLNALQPGDLLFWGGVGSAYHVAIYAGGGQYVHAPAPGQSVTMQSMSYFAPSFAKRL